MAGTVDALTQSASKRVWRKESGSKGTGRARSLTGTPFRWGTEENSAKSPLGEQTDGVELCATDMSGAPEAWGPSLTPA